MKVKVQLTIVPENGESAPEPRPVDQNTIHTELLHTAKNVARMLGSPDAETEVEVNYGTNHAPKPIQPP